ncbi:AAA family ATPase [Mesorhizobium sp. AR02]|uniref:AAA family ATPase n=1 Tax=Mesorhizobium sp. AR02 TaxID=2865837 RepID=UPI00215F9CE4|nr:ATP-binding protein [Mesorhizobium sp. AR02]
MPEPERTEAERTEAERFVWQKLRRHFNTDDLTALVSSRWKFNAHLLPDLQSLIEDLIAPRSPELLGFHQMYEFLPMKLSDLTTSEGEHVVRLAPVQRQDIDIGEDEPYPSINNGIWLITIDDGTPAAIMLSKLLTCHGPMVQVEIGHMPNELGHAFAKHFLRTIEAQGKSSRYYRNKAVSFESSGGFGGTQETMRVHKLPAVSRNDVVLSKATMAQLDTHIFDFVKCREELKRLGQSGRKGILLHGHPGTGKTHVVHYIAANLPEHTTVLVTAEQMLDMEEYFALARVLQPCIMVIEDVDLVGRSREDISGQMAETRLNRLLNELDGLGVDSDILIIMTTNRLNSLEGALASRSGRVDVALEIPLPDDGCRERLIEQYGHALNFQGEALAEAVARSRGGSAAYVKEMVRRLTQRSVARGGSLSVSREDVKVVFADAEAVLNPLKRDEETVRRHIVEEDDEDDCDC